MSEDGKTAESLAELTKSGPIEDTDQTLRELAGLSQELERLKEPEETKEEAWEKPFKDFTEQQSKTLEAINALSQTVAQLAQVRPTERIIERQTPAPPAPAPKRSWRDQLKPEQADLLEEAIRDEARGLYEDYKQKELMPALTYLTSVQERLVERDLNGKYPDEDFGYGALAQDAKRYREASGFGIDLETAYAHVAFDRMQSALALARRKDSDAALKAKREVPVDEGGSTKPAPGTDREEDLIAEDERKVARMVFGEKGADGKLRTQRELDRLWIEQRIGAKRDQMMGET